MKPTPERKRKMQDVDFRHMDEFLEYLPGDECRMVEKLRGIVLDMIPDVTEKLSYNVPFYSRHRRICFIWPSSIPWGGIRQQGVRFGFAQGRLLQDDLGFLSMETRKQVGWHDFHAFGEIDTGLLQSYLSQAVIWDALQQRTK